MHGQENVSAAQGQGSTAVQGSPHQQLAAAAIMALHSDDDDQVGQEEQEEGQELLQGHEEQDATMEDGQDKDAAPLVDTIQRGMDAMSSKQDELYDQVCVAAHMTGCITQLQLAALLHNR